MPLPTRLTQLLNITHPLIQGPLGGFSSQRLTAAVSNFGGLGSFGAHGLSPAAIQDTIAEIRSLTPKPFAMNLWVSMQDQAAFTSTPEDFQKSLTPLAPHIHALGGKLTTYKPYTPIRFDDQARVLLDANVPVFSFIFGIPPKEILDECRAKGILTIGAATTPKEALALQNANVDAIVASGFEAGGHRGSFLRPAEDSLTGTISLVPQIVDLVKVPVIAAGGITDARGILAAFALGAQAVQMGTVFLACEESGASPHHRAAILSGDAGRTALTKAFTGRLARGIDNQLMQELNAPTIDILPYPLQRYLMKNLSTLTEKAGLTGLIPLWAGQSANLARHTKLHELLTSLIDEIQQIAGPILEWNRQRTSD